MTGFLISIIILFFCCIPAGAEQYKSKIFLDTDNLFDQQTYQNIKDLESQLDSITDNYARAMTGRKLAQNYINKKQYNKAAEFYNEAVKAEGLSELIAGEMIKELALVYVLLKDYTKVILTLEKLQTKGPIKDVNINLILIQAHAKSGNYTKTSKLIQQLMESQPDFTETQLTQIMAFSYRVGNYGLCEKILHRLIDKYPNQGKYWLQLCYVNLASGKHRKALDQLALARSKKIHFTKQEILLLSDLYAVNKIPHRAAQLLESALADKEIEPEAVIYKQIFNFWLQAREPDKAILAMEKATILTKDTQLYLHLAQMQMEQERWPQMHKTLLKACRQSVEERFVSRLNLLLGICQLKLNRPKEARRSFINATLIGHNPKAGEWLRYMNAKPATAKELREITSPCRPANAKVLQKRVVSPKKKSPEKVLAKTSSNIQTKTIYNQYFAYSSHQLLEDAKFEKKVIALATRLAMKIMKEGKTISGPLNMIYGKQPDKKTSTPKFKLAFPVKRKSVEKKGKFGFMNIPQFKCVYMTYTGKKQKLDLIIEKFFTATKASGHKPTDEFRLIFDTTTSKDKDFISVELQIGIN